MRMWGQVFLVVIAGTLAAAHIVFEGDDDTDPRPSNPCPEGYFANLKNTDSDCRPLDVSLGDIPMETRDTLRIRLHIDVDTVFAGKPEAKLGFDLELFPTSIAAPELPLIELEDCAPTSFRTAFDLANSLSGAVIRLPSCQESIDSTLHLTSSHNVILEGKGSNLTVLESASNRPKAPIIHIEKSRNIIVRDLGFRLHDAPLAHIAVDASTNVLFERISVENPGSPGIRVQHSTRVTIRYSEFLGGPKSFSDPGCQDGWFKHPPPRGADLDGDQRGSVSECEQKWGDGFSPGSVWSASYAFYSNVTSDNSFALHSTLGEIAGNRFIRPVGSKLADGWFWWVHDNDFTGTAAGNRKTPAFWTTSDGVIDRRSRFNVIYGNRFADLGVTPLRSHRSSNYVIGNEFVSNKLAPSLGKHTVICPDTEEAAIVESGAPGVGKPAIALAGGDGPCGGERKGTFWRLPNVSSGPPEPDE